ncbi:hypothetical protein DO513_24455 [Salmonella enterica]|nr:hypothetical protein [Salmonella enterica]
MTNKLNDGLRVKPIADFSADDLHETHKIEMDEYIRLRVQGISRGKAMRQAFSIPLNRGVYEEDAHQMEAHPYFVENFNKALRETPISELWDERKAVILLTGLANGETDSRTKALAAIELNILCGITR